MLQFFLLLTVCARTSSLWHPYPHTHVSSSRLFATTSSPTTSNNQQAVPKNLKTVPVSADVDKLTRWKELQGLSEKEIITTPGLAMEDRSERGVTLAYKRCEYVTKLFSKTFYMGTSLMRPDARQHVWAIYAWCRRTDDIVDSPRALLNRDVLSKDLQEWGARLDGIWRGGPPALSALPLVDTPTVTPPSPPPLLGTLAHAAVTPAIPLTPTPPPTRPPAMLCRSTRGCRSSRSGT